MKNQLLVRDLVTDLELQILCGQHEVEGRGGLKNPVEQKEYRIPGLELAGYIDFLPEGQILLLGETENRFLSLLSPDEVLERLSAIFTRSFPCVILSSESALHQVLHDQAEKHQRPILRTGEEFNRFKFLLTNYLHLRFAPKKTLHGVLVEVYGVGILILGSSATGKSECALELIKRGHRLIADDSVELVRVSDHTVIGMSNPLIGHHMEIRGLGIIDIARLFGVAATTTEKRVDLILSFEKWDDNAQYDRLGMEEKQKEILDVMLPTITIPVMAGRNLAVLVETAAMDYNLKRHGIHSARNFSQLIRSHISTRTRQAQESPILGGIS